MIFGTGASEKDGLKESEWTVQYMLEHFGDLQNFAQFRGINLNKLKKYVKSHVVAEKISQNTYEEIKRAWKLFSQRGIERIIIVSNPDHISRCMQVVHQIYLESLYPVEILAVQSDIGYDGTEQITSKIIEPPHRGDDPNPDLSKHIGNYFKLPLEEKRKFVEIVKNFFENYNSE